MRIGIVFPGQGTQQPGMGEVWTSDPAWSVVGKIESLVGEPVGALITKADADTLSHTREAQLAVLLTSMVAWRALAQSFASNLAYDIEIVGFAGHSLGQVSALVAAGVIDVASGVQFAARRAAATQSAADAHPGRMAALIGASLEQATQACAASPGGAWIANDNAPGQVVIAGSPAGLEQAIDVAKSLGVRKAMPLAVGGAFHTPLMESACPALASAVESMAFSTPTTPVVSNADARPHHDGEPWRHRLVTHPTQPVRWRETLLTLRDELGAQVLLEVGFGAMIAGVAKRTMSDVPVIGIASPNAIESLPSQLDEARVTIAAMNGSISEPA